MRDIPTRPSPERLPIGPALLLLAALTACAPATVEFAAAPQRLADTGLYADFAARTLHADVLAFTPQYPLWTDGATKRRYVALPKGSTIDASDVDHWDFPAGTRLWKEFAFEGRAVETRILHRRTDGTWLYATYRWSEDGREARLASENGEPKVAATGEGTFHDLPSVADCRICHESQRTPVLGFSALQLSPDRDPLAPNAEPPRPDDIDLHALERRGLLRGLPPRWHDESPRIAAQTPHERAALGYLHGNCSNCHNGEGPLQRLGLRFDHPLDAHGLPPGLATTLGKPSRFVRGDASLRIAPGHPERSTLVQRLAATDPLTRMPPLARHRADEAAIELLRRWIGSLEPDPAVATTDH